MLQYMFLCWTKIVQHKYSRILTHLLILIIINNKFLRIVKNYSTENDGSLICFKFMIVCSFKMMLLARGTEFFYLYDKWWVWKLVFLGGVERSYLISSTISKSLYPNKMMYKLHDIMQIMYALIGNVLVSVTSL